jgi:hypothetical protein
MTTQGVLFDAAEGTAKLHALSAGLERTLAALDAEGRILPRHASIVERARYFAMRAETASGIAGTNWGKLYAEAEAALLELEAPPSEVSDESGDRVTKLSAFLRRAHSAGDVPDAASA